MGRRAPFVRDSPGFKRLGAVSGSVGPEFAQPVGILSTNRSPGVIVPLFSARRLRIPVGCFFGALAFVALGCGQDFGQDSVDAGAEPVHAPDDWAPHSLDPGVFDWRLPPGIDGAELVVVGKVEDVRSDFGENERGDELILSTVTLSVQESLRGEAPPVIEFEIEGGTVDDLTLKVSDAPELRPGDVGAFALREDRVKEGWVPNWGTDGVRVIEPGPVLRWESSSKWGVNVVHFRINPSNNDVTDSQAISGVRIGARAWTDQSGAAFRYAYDGTSTSTTIGMNGTNLVVFRNEQGSSPTTRATSYQWMIGSEIIESDIAFWDGSMTFVTGTMSCSNAIYIENTGVHEFGHSLGLEHTPVTTATMYGFSSACSKSRLPLDPDDIEGVETLYPCSTNSQCNDARLCTSDVCQAGTCKRTPIPNCCTSASQCGDGNACTTDTCESNECHHSTISGCCTSASQCGDGNACTTDTCESNECHHSTISGCCTSASQCGDGNACTTDTCESNECYHDSISGCCTSASQCDDDDPCTADSCDANQCTHAPIEDCGGSEIDGGPGAADGGPGAADGGLVDAAEGRDGSAQFEPPDAGTPGAATPDPVTGGCALGTAADSGSGAWWMLFVGLVALAWTRRRRSSHRRE